MLSLSLNSKPKRSFPFADRNQIDRLSFSSVSLSFEYLKESLPSKSEIALKAHEDFLFSSSDNRFGYLIASATYHKESEMIILLSNCEKRGDQAIGISFEQLKTLLKEMLSVGDIDRSEIENLLIEK